MDSGINNISRFRIDHSFHKLHYAMHSAHSHTYYELFYMMHGNCTISIDDRLFTLSEGNIILIPANSVHRTSYIGELIPERTYIEFSKDYIETISQTLGKNWAGRNLWGHILYIEKDKREKIDLLFREIQKEYDIVDGYSDCCIRQLFQYLIINLVRLDRITTDIKDLIAISDNKTNQDMIIAAKYIAENFKNDITLKDVASHLNLNPSYFSSKFKAFNNIGFSEYLRNIRINHAEWYLIETDLSLSDIAGECGFCNSNYFGDTFKLVNGISPSEFRKNNKPKKAEN